MNRGTTIFVVFCVCTMLAGCAKDPDNKASVSNVVTPDIQAGIEKYIEDQTRAGGGYFAFSSDGKEYLFKLVRVHTEYLANLGPRSHFACVDLVDTRGDVYDVDFFLAGDPGAMTVTETTLHKLNGIPFYAWKQNRKGVWERIPMESASQELLGVKTGRDEFEFNYQATLPVITTTARMWLPLPATDAFQKVQMTIVSAPGKHRVLKEREHDNTILFFELGPEDSEKSVHIRYHVQRLEKAAYLSKDPDLKKYLKEESLVPIDDNFRTIASESVTGKKGDLVRARALYDHVIERMSYIKHGPGWGRGDAVFACNVRTGNCTDFHAYFIALARSIGIPARFAIGAAIPSSRNDGGVDGYHCWVEFHAEGKWWPVDISEADKYSSLSTYYFGHHPANRFEFSRGRDLVVEPGPVSGPINFLAYPVLEIGNEPAKVVVTFTFKRTVSGI